MLKRRRLSGPVDVRLFQESGRKRGIRGSCPPLRILEIIIIYVTVLPY